jgi:hypothetical protein
VQSKLKVACAIAVGAQPGRAPSREIDNVAARAVELIR